MTARLARHATLAALTAVSIDAAYTAVFWLVLGRPHVAWKYFLIVGQLSAETALIIHLSQALRQTEKASEATEGGAASMMGRGAKEPVVGLVRLDQCIAHPHNIRRDLGDLRALTASIVRHGVMVPIIVEKYGLQLRIRAGHRRVTAARMAGVYRVAAIIHPEPLDEEDWLVASVQENYQRRDLDAEERRRTVLRLRDLGLTWSGIAEAFGVTPATVRVWTVEGEKPDRPDAEARQEAKTARASGQAVSAAKVRAVAVSRLIDAHLEEFEQLKSGAYLELSDHLAATQPEAGAA